MADHDYTNQTPRECAANVFRDWGRAAGNYIAGRWIGAILRQQEQEEAFWRSAFVALFVMLMKVHTADEIMEILAGGVERLEAQQTAEVLTLKEQAA